MAPRAALFRRLSIIAALALASCGGQGEASGTITLMNESGKMIRSAQVNVVITDSHGRLLASPVDSYDQIYRLGDIPQGEQRIVKYRPRSEYNIDTLVTWEDGATARYSYGYVTDGWGAPSHVIIVGASRMLFDGVPPIDVQSDPEKNYGKYSHLESPWSN